MIFLVAVVAVPGVIVQFAVTKRISRRCSGSARILPFGFGWQSIVVTGLGAKPLAIFVCGVLRHADCGKAKLPHSETHFGVRRGWLADAVDNRVNLGVVVTAGTVFFASRLSDHKRFVLVPCDFVFAHPKGIHAHFGLWPFDFTAEFFVWRTAHQKFATLNRHHRKGHLGKRDLAFVVLHGGFGIDLGCLCDQCVNLGDQIDVVTSHLGANLFGFFNKRQIGWPQSALINPASQHFGHAAGKRSARILGRHQTVVVFANNRRRIKRTVSRLERFDRIAVKRQFASRKIQTAFGVVTTVTGNTLLFQNRLNVLNKINAWLHAKRFFGFPFGTAHDPFADQFRLRFVQRRFRGHQFVVIQWQDHRCVQTAFLGFSRNECLQRALHRVEPQAAFGFFGSMAVHTSGRQDVFDDGKIRYGFL